MSLQGKQWRCFLNRASLTHLQSQGRRNEHRNGSWSDAGRSRGRWCGRSFKGCEPLGLLCPVLQEANTKGLGGKQDKIHLPSVLIAVLLQQSSSELGTTAESDSGVTIRELLGTLRSGDSWDGAFEQQLMNLMRERKKHLCTREQVIHWHRERKWGWASPSLASSAGHAREMLRDTSHLEEAMPSWNGFTPDLASISKHLLLSGSLHQRQEFENLINFPEQSRVACRILKILIWGCLKRLEGGWGLSSSI